MILMYVITFTVPLFILGFVFWYIWFDSRQEREKIDQD